MRALFVLLVAAAIAFVAVSALKEGADSIRTHKERNYDAMEQL
jgi:hypothetical protein